MPVDVIGMCWAIFRITFRAFTESIFIFLLINTNFNYSNGFNNSNCLNKKKMFLFSSIYSSIVLFTVYSIDTAELYRLVLVPLVFFYFWFRQKKSYKNLLVNYSGIHDIRYALTTSIILILAMESFNTTSHMIFHTSFVLAGVYDTVRSVDIFYQLYKTGLMFLDVFFIFLSYKFKFIKMKDIKSMSLHKWVPITFGFCLLSMVYVDYIYGSSMSPLPIEYCNTLVWTMGLMLPSYIGIYLTTTKLTRLLSFKANHTKNKSIRLWICNPSVIEINHLNVYNSDVFMSKFEVKRLEFEEMLKKLGIDDEYKGYSELIFCLFLTKLFIGLKGWRFEREIFEQASLVVDVPMLLLRKNIEDIIAQIWTTNDARTLIDGYYRPCHNINTYDQTQRPTVEQFLTDIAKSI